MKTALLSSIALLLVIAVVACGSTPPPAPATPPAQDVSITPPSSASASATPSATPPPDDAPSSTVASSPPDPAPVDTSPPAVPDPQPTAAEKKACSARGGKMQPVCMLGHLECVVTFRDAGKRCTDKKDCTGECLFEGPGAPPKSNVVGKCQRTSDPCGCRTTIVHGQIKDSICVD